jgi:predicted dehydrogenase/nucleoside-diphosphate-sugar epimerase
MSTQAPTTAQPSRSPSSTADGGGNDDPLRIVLLGAGTMAGHHATAIQRLAPGARVVGVADPSPRALEAMGKLIPGAALESDAARLFATVEADVAHVCTPPAHHVDGARAALEAGLHVYVEKPFAPTEAEARALLDLARKRGAKICAGHQLLAERPSVEALRLLPALRRLVHVESYFAFRPIHWTADGSAPFPHHLQLLDILPHPVYLLVRFLEAATRSPVELAALEAGSSGTLHALVRAGEITGTLIVTLEGRPIENYVRLVGSNGSITPEYVRGTVKRSLGPGVSGIDKVLGPYRESRQLVGRTTGALLRRAVRRQRSYPGLAELFDGFYRSIRKDLPSPVSEQNILATTRICQAVEEALSAPRSDQRRIGTAERGGRVAVTGGTGFLGTVVVRALREAGRPVTVVARRAPPPWDLAQDVTYITADLARGPHPEAFAGAEAVIHCAAATSGGWDAHQAHSLDATENVLRAAHEAGVRRFIHVSSLSVLEGGRGATLSEDSPLHADSRAGGPYAWGKAESERIARARAAELSIAIKIVRPGAIMDENAFDPPGVLGRRIGNLFVAVGSPRDPLPTVDVELVARTLIWMLENFTDAPDVLHMIDPDPPTKRSLVARFRRESPDLRVVWLPRLLLQPLSWAALVAQKILRPGQKPVNVAAVFARLDYDTAEIRRLTSRMAATEDRNDTPQSVEHR